MTTQASIASISERVGIGPKTIRYYEDIGLLSPTRSPNGYRIFSMEDENKLFLIKRSKMLGLSLKEIRTILQDMQSGQCDKVKSHTKELMFQKIAQIDSQVQELTLLRNFLTERFSTIDADNRTSTSEGCSCLGDNF